VAVGIAQRAVGAKSVYDPPNTDDGVDNGTDWDGQEGCRIRKGGLDYGTDFSITGVWSSTVRLSLAPDGKNLATSIRRYRGELWMLEGFDNAAKLVAATLGQIRRNCLLSTVCQTFGAFRGIYCHQRLAAAVACFCRSSVSCDAGGASAMIFIEIEDSEKAVPSCTPHKHTKRVRRTRFTSKVPAKTSSTHRAERVIGLPSCES
jgi:hypothetical protein